VDLVMSFNAGSTAISATQFDLLFDSAQLSVVSVTAGTAAVAAAKEVAHAVVVGGHRVLVFGFNQNVINSGQLAVIRFHLAAGASGGTLPITVSNFSSSTPGGMSAPTNGVNGSIVILSVDTAAPGRSNGAPSGTLAAHTSQTTLSLNTDENATCRHSTTPGTLYGSMTNNFSASPGGMTHTALVGGLQAGSFSYYVRCRDVIGNANTTDFTIAFQVASPVDMVAPAPPTNLRAN